MHSIVKSREVSVQKSVEIENFLRSLTVWMAALPLGFLIFHGMGNKFTVQSAGGLS